MELTEAKLREDFKQRKALAKSRQSAKLVPVRGESGRIRVQADRRPVTPTWDPTNDDPEPPSDARPLVNVRQSAEVWGDFIPIRMHADGRPVTPTAGEPPSDPRYQNPGTGRQELWLELIPWANWGVSQPTTTESRANEGEQRQRRQRSRKRRRHTTRRQEGTLK